MNKVLDRYIAFEVNNPTKDVHLGGEVDNWTEYKRAWACVEDVTSRNQETAEDEMRVVKHPCRVYIRYDDSIVSDMRVRLLDRDGRLLQITSQPAEIGRRAFTEFSAMEFSV